VDTAADTHRRAVSNLHTAGLMLGDLADVAEEWESLSIDERMSWSLDWGNEMSGLVRVARVAAQGLLTESECQQYQRLLHGLKAALPTLERLNLRLPEVPLVV
jgi:hypothetical protein